MTEAKVVADYITLEMKKNLISSSAQRLRENNQSILSKPKAMMEWKRLVDYNRPWDHKPYIEATYGRWSLDTQTNTEFFFDIWSNVHYGYIGKSVGFSAWTLLSGAGLAQLLGSDVPDGYIARRLEKIGDADFLSAFDDPRDQISINIGIQLWDRYQQHINSGLLLDSVRRSASELNTK